MFGLLGVNGRGDRVSVTQCEFQRDNEVVVLRFTYETHQKPRYATVCLTAKEATALASELLKQVVESESILPSPAEECEDMLFVAMGMYEEHFA